MIIVRIFGGLGNQMYQYAVAKKLSLMRKDTIKFDLEWFASNTNDTKREYGLNVFGIDENRASLIEINRLKNRNKNNIIVRILRKIIGKQFGIRKSYINDANFSMKNFLTLRNIYLDISLLNEEFIRDIRDVLLTVFTPKDILVKEYGELIDLIKNSNSCSLHIRRGDYVVSEKTNNYHGTCTIEYYKEAMRIIKEKINDTFFFVFSDDINWCKANFKGDNIDFIDFMRPDYFDMYLMSLCKNNIIANSSFSYWGAYLNQNDNKVVIAPSIWFKNEEANKKSAGLIPENWIRI